MLVACDVEIVEYTVMFRFEIGVVYAPEFLFVFAIWDRTILIGIDIAELEIEMPPNSYFFIYIYYRNKKKVDYFEGSVK
jgi:hypothetical protein